MPGFNVSNVGQGPSGRPQVYMTYTWEIGPVYGSAVSFASPLVRLRDSTLPTFTVGKNMMKGASLEYKFAESVNWDDVRLTWYDTTGLLSEIKKWRKAVWTEDTGLQPASEYKRPSRLWTFLTDYEPDNANHWDLVNSWPSVIRHGELTYTNTDFKVVEVTLTYDWAREFPGGEKPDFGISSGPPTLLTH